MQKDLFIYASLFLLCMLGAFFAFNVPLVDTGAYIHSLHYFQDTSLNDYDLERVLSSYVVRRPLGILFAIPLVPLLGTRISLSIVNALFYFLGTFLVYLYFTRFFGKKMLGYLSALLYCTSLPIVLYSTMNISETPVYFFLLLGMWIIDVQLKKNTWLSHVWINLTIGLFVLSKEYIFVLYPYYVLMHVFRSVREKGVTFKNIAFDLRTVWRRIPHFLTLPLSLLPTFIFAKLSGTGYFFEGKASKFGLERLSVLGLLRLVLVTVGSFHVGVFTALTGFFLDKDARRRFFYVVVFISCLPLILGAHFLAFLSPRMVFVLFPAVVSTSAYALFRFSEYLCKKGYFSSLQIPLALSVFSYATISYVGAWFYPSHFELPENASAGAIFQITLESIMLKLGGIF